MFIGFFFLHFRFCPYFGEAEDGVCFCSLQFVGTSPPTSLGFCGGGESRSFFFTRDLKEKKKNQSTEELLK